MREALWEILTMYWLVWENIQKKENYTYKRLYRNLYNTELFLQAYQNIYANTGNMTKGVDNQTISAMSLERINKIIDSLKDESYSPTPTKEYIFQRKTEN